MIPAAILCPPPFSNKFNVTASRTSAPKSMPLIERPDPMPLPSSFKAMAKTGQKNALLNGMQEDQ